MNKKIIIITLLIPTMSFAGNVKDSNNGVQGNVLIHTGNIQGQHNDVGKWVDSSSLFTDYSVDILNINNDIMNLQNHSSQSFRYTSGSENQINNFGYNDYFSENAFKNNLINNGYSKIYDTNNSNLDLIEVGYYGLTGKPNKFDKDYVLREEWKKYSSQYQDIRIDKNKNIINTVNNNHTNWNNNQDSQIRNINNMNNRQDKAISNNSSRISDLEKTQFIVGGVIRVYDGKKWQINTFVDYSSTRNKVDRTGVRFTYKVGKSYEEKRIEELEALIKQRLPKQNVTEQEGEFYFTETGFGIKNKF